MRVHRNQPGHCVGLFQLPALPTLTADQVSPRGMLAGNLDHDLVALRFLA